MLRENDRIRSFDVEIDKQSGILLIFSIKGGIETIGSGDYASFGQTMMKVKMTEIKLA